MEFPIPASVENYVRYDVPNTGEITAFSVSLWIYDYPNSDHNGVKFIFSYSPTGGNDILVGRDTGKRILTVHVLGRNSKIPLGKFFSNI